MIRAINDKLAGRGRLWEACRDKMMHALRHLYAYERLAGGMSAVTLAQRLGHTDPAYTLRDYCHQVSDDQAEERRQIDRTLRRLKLELARSIRELCRLRPCEQLHAEPLKSLRSSARTSRAHPA